MVIAGVLLILAVLLDAWRRMRSERYSRVRMSAAARKESAEETGPEGDMPVLRELPNGGARVVRREDLLDAVAAAEEALEAVQSTRVASAEPPPPKQRSTDSLSEKARTPKVDPEPAAEQAPEEEEFPESSERDDLLAGISTTEEPTNLDWLDGLGEEPVRPREKPEMAPGKLPREIDPQVFMLNVTARDAQGFRGEDILHILLACDLRFGDMNFFHRHEHEAGKGAIQFSVANMMQPGVFDIDNMGDFRTPGLVFFVTLPGPEDMMQAFDYMLETARCVAKNLSGDVLDESRSALTSQSLDHARQRIRELERKLLTQAAH